MLLNKLTFAFISLVFVIQAFVIAGISSQTEDSYTVGIYRNQNENWQKKSKWSKNAMNIDSCGGIFREKQVLIRSPGYSIRNYPKNVNCEYIFYSPFVCANQFHIQFLDFQLEPSLSCSKDKIKIGDEILCGQVIGIMKYKAINGSLNIQFTSDQTIENIGFELLVTRLPCETDDDKSIKSSINLPTTISLTVDSGGWTPRQNSIEPTGKHTKSISLNRSLENQSQTTYIKPVCIKKGHAQPQLNGVWPDMQWPNAQWPNPYSPLPQVPPSPPAINLPGFLPELPQTLPSCCINVYNQQTFYLISPGFPRLLHVPIDCLFYVERLHANVCRLRIEFKYFLLGSPLEQLQCTHNFLEIDGQRFCGCKTGTIYRTQWGPSPKAIRFTNLVQQPGIQGFVLEITQEPCPYRVRLTNQPSLIRASQRLLPAQNYLTHINDPNRCSYNYFSWLNFNTNQDILAKSICIRNFAG